MNKVLEAQTYTEFRKALVESNCDRCELCKSRAQIVADRGNPEAKILFIGEAPGENEDREGLAFVGRSGKLLDAMLSDVGLNTNRDALIINVVKCRPPANRAPKPEEAGACELFLKKQIELVRPKVILFLGATSFKHLFKDLAKSPMKNQVGKFFTHAEYPGVSFMALYHPAYILRDPRKRPVFLAHLKVFREKF